MTARAAILATLVYHDIFDYPLTAQEAYSYLTIKTTYASFNKNLQLLIKEKRVSQENGLIFLRGRGQTVKIRQARKGPSVRKLKKALRYSKILRFVPTIRFVAISGALSMENTDTNDDIDLVIVTGKGALWTTRLLANLILWPYRRKAGEAHTKDKACLNMFLEENSLKFGTQNLYTAHETAQLKPIWERGKTYASLLKANSWLQSYLPNWRPQQKESFKTYGRSSFWSLVSGTLSLAEPLTKRLQLRYMRRRITTEQIRETQLFFHPGNTQQYVLGKYKAKLKTLKLR